MDTLDPIILNNNTVIIKNKNTTVGYARFDIKRMVLEYLFVNPMFLRCGVRSKLLATAEKVAGSNLKPAEPISPVGKEFFKSKCCI